MATLMKQPSAFLPLAMSAAALSLVIGHIAIYGIVREADEGAAAHLFQLIMVAQAPIILYFTAKWLPREPRRALGVLALQLAAVVAAFAPILIFEM